MGKKYTVVHKENEAGISWDGIMPAEIDCYLWEENGYSPKAYAKACHTGQSIHVLLGAFEKEIKAVYEEMNEPVYKDSCLEFFIQPDPEKDGRYLNFEFNSKGVLLLGLGWDRNDRVLLDKEALKLFDIKAFVKPAGDINEWGVEFRIPFGFLKQLFPGFETASPGNMKGNFYKCGDDTLHPHFGCWSRIASDNPDFHVSRFFGTLVLE